MEPRADIPEGMVLGILKSMDRAGNITARVIRLNTVLFFTSLISAASTTFITAFAATQGPIVGSGIAGWKFSCAIAALFGFGTTIVEGLKYPTGVKLLQSRLCLERLQLLDTSLRYSQRSVEDIAREFDEIVRIYPETIGSQTIGLQTIGLQTSGLQTDTPKNLD
jgi:hypothetical protein